MRSKKNIKNKNILVLNLPFYRPIIRRYSCSYYGIGFLYPPIELLRVATIIEKFYKRPKFIDAIAERKKIDEIANFIFKNKITHIITLLGIDFLAEDLRTLNALRSILKVKYEYDVKIIAINYILSTLLKIKSQKEINDNRIIKGKNKIIEEMIRNLEKYKMPDFILDRNFEDAIYRWLNNNDEFYLTPDAYEELSFNPDIIEHEDYSFIDLKRYNELFTHGKTGFMYFGFGCPFNCIYCIRAYDIHGYKKRKSDNIKKELIYMKKLGVKNIRVLDDNVTIDLKMLNQIAEFLEEKNIKFNFYGLSRIDLINEKSVKILKRLNFKRLYLGLETFSQTMQKFYHKNIDVNMKHLREKTKLLRKAKIEFGFWLLYHPLKDNEKVIKEMIKKIKIINPDYVNLSLLTPYLGTKLFEIDNEYIVIKDLKTEYKNINPKLEYLFFRSLLFYPPLILKRIKTILKYPLQSFEIIRELLLPSKRKIRDDFI